MKENLIISEEEILEGQRAMSDMDKIKKGGATFNKKEGIVEFTEEEIDKARDEMLDALKLDEYRKLPQADKQKLIDYIKARRENKEQRESIIEKIRLLEEELLETQVKLNSIDRRNSVISKDFGITQLEKIIAEEEK